MAFSASKERKRKTKPLATGKQLVANAGIEAWYRDDLDALIGDMLADYRAELQDAYKKRTVKEYYTADASATSIMNRTLRRLRTKWTEIFGKFADRHALMFADKANRYSEFSAKHSLKSLGLDDPKDAKKSEIRDVLQASIAENVALIKNIQQDVANDVEGAVYRSLASNDPTQGTTAVMEELVERGGITRRRAAVIARDQNSKLYTNLNKARMEANGVEKFKWKHSSAGKTQRRVHVDRQTQDVGYGPGIFRFDSPELWEVRQADAGLPGEAINCRCRMVPVFDF